MSNHEYAPQTHIAESQGIPEALVSPETGREKHFTQIVVIPYGLDMNAQNSVHPTEPILTHFAAFSVNAAQEYYHHLQDAGQSAKIVLCGSRFFGENAKSENDVMEAALTGNNVTEHYIEHGFSEEEAEQALRPNPLAIPADDIIRIDAPNENTPIQIRNLASHQRQNAPTEPMLVITADFHHKRVAEEMEEFGLQAKIIDAPKLHKFLRPTFNLSEYERIMQGPYHEYERLDKIARLIPTPILNAITKVRGPRQIDVEKNDGTLHLSTKTANQVRKVAGA